ncbi:hypothetical protein LCGC14_2961930, partial [marine sediment metagenome]
RDPYIIETDTVFCLTEVSDYFGHMHYVAWRVFAYLDGKKQALWGINHKARNPEELRDARLEYDWILDEPLLALADKGLISWEDYHRAII